jgi:hypothetical protein
MFREIKNQSSSDLKQFAEVERIFSRGSESFAEKIDAFPKFASRQSIAKFLTKYEIYKKIVNVNGSIIEGGVLTGGGLLAWAKLSSILEPVAHPRKIIGFDTFGGFPSISSKDSATGDSSHMSVGALKGSSLEEVEEAVALYDINRPLNHIPKVELVKGDASTTAKEYLAANPHLVVALINLDVDLYEPTKALLEAFVPRMPKGAVIVFDQMNAKMFPGETMAALDVVGIRNLRIERFPFDSWVSYAVLD